MLAEKIINDIDKAKPEVVIQVAVMQARRDRLKNMGIQPGTSAQLAFTPPTSSSSTTAATTLALNQLPHLTTGDYDVTLHGPQPSFLMTDSTAPVTANP